MPIVVGDQEALAIWPIFIMTPFIAPRVPATSSAVCSARSSRSSWRCSPAAAESMAYLLDPPGLDEGAAGFWQDVRDAAIAILPEWARELYGYGTPPLSPGRRAEIRQSLGVLDAIFLGEPGVLEARQRITLRMRAARSA